MAFTDLHWRLSNMSQQSSQLRASHLRACLQVNKSPFDDGWLMKVKVTDKGQLDSLLDADAYKAECESH